MIEKDPHGLDAHAPGSKLDAGKMRPWLCISGFARALASVADVTTRGAVKYTPDGWKDVKDGPKRYMDAFGRHMLALGRGEQIDPETSCLHKAQMIWNLLASLELELSAECAWETPAQAIKARYDEQTERLSKSSQTCRAQLDKIKLASGPDESARQWNPQQMAPNRVNLADALKDLMAKHQDENFLWLTA